MLSGEMSDNKPKMYVIHYHYHGSGMYHLVANNDHHARESFKRICDHGELDIDETNHTIEIVEMEVEATVPSEEGSSQEASGEEDSSQEK